jgi:hypothetical protein
MNTDLRTFENRVLMTIFGPKRDEITASWRKLHNEELHNDDSSGPAFPATHFFGLTTLFFNFA